MTTTYPNRPFWEVNPKNEPTGHLTGRCRACGSNDLWEDNHHYGCNNCGAFYAEDNNPAPRLTEGGS